MKTRFLIPVLLVLLAFALSGSDCLLYEKVLDVVSISTATTKNTWFGHSSKPCGGDPCISYRLQTGTDYMLW